MSTRTRRKLAVVIVAGMSLVAAACGDTKSSKPASSGEASPTTTASSGSGADPLAAIGIDLAKCPSGYDPKQGLANNEILIGQSVPQTGTYAAFGLIATSMKAYFDYANAELNGINGKKLKLVVKDDAYDPDRTGKNVDELIDRDGVFAFSGILGTPQNLTVWDKINDACIPHLFPSSGAPDWGDAAKHPWTVSGAVVPYNLEARIWADTIKEKFPNGATVALLEADNDFGKTYDYWFKKYIEGSNIKLTVEKHDPAAANITNQMTSLANTKADVAIGGTTSTFCTQFLKGIGDDPNWKPSLKLVSGTCRSSVFTAGAGAGAVDARFLIAIKDLSDPALANDASIQKVRDLMVKYGIDKGLLSVGLIPSGWIYGEVLRDVLIRADAKPGGLTRPNVLLAARETDFTSPSGLIFDGIQLKLSGTSDTYMIESARYDRWNGTGFERASDPITKYEGQLVFERPR